MTSFDMLTPLFKARRKELNLTQDEIAEQIGISSKAYSKIETGKNNLDATYIAPLCQVLDMPLHSVIALAFMPDFKIENPLRMMQIPELAQSLYPTEKEQRDLERYVKPLTPRLLNVAARVRAKQLTQDIWHNQDSITIKELFERDYGINL